MLSRMDTNKKGLVSLPALPSGVPQTESLRSPLSAPHPRARPSVHRGISRLKGEDYKRTSSGIPGQADSDGGTWLFSSVKYNEHGFARSEEVLDLLEGIGVYNGADVFQFLDLNPHGQVSLSDLIAAFNDALTKSSTPEPVLTAAFICTQQELKHLKCLMEQSMEENKRLKLDLSEANAHNVLLALEVDERHVQLDKSWESKLLDTLGNIKDTYWFVDQKYQDKIKELQTEMDKLRMTGAAKISLLSSQLEEGQNQAAEVEQQLVKRLASSQREIAQLDKTLADSSEQLILLNKQNENLKKDLQLKLQLLESPEDYKSKIMQLKQAMAKTNEENLKLKDDNDELISELEKMQQKLLLAHKKVDCATNRLSVSSFEASQRDEDNFTNDDSTKQQTFRNQQNMGTMVQSLDFHCKTRPSLSKELSQCENEEIIEQKLKEIEHKYQMAVNILEEKNNSERRRMLDNFDQEKKSLINEQKKKDETPSAKQLNDLQTSFAQEKFDLIQKCASEKNYMNHLHEQEIKTLQNRLKEAEFYIEDNTRMRNLIHNLETQLIRCHSDIQNHENQKSDFDIRLWQKEMILRCDFEEEKKNLAEQFSFEFEQQDLRHKREFDGFFIGGAESLTGKLKDDFNQIVRESTEKEVRHSQTTILNQLQRDRGKMVTTMEQEKKHIYEKAGNERKALVEKYEIQIGALQTELSQVYSQLEAEKQILSEMSLRIVEESVASENAVENLRKKMEGELVIELTRIKEHFESEKRELVTEKAMLEEKLSELQRLFAIERKRAVEITTLKATIKILRAEKAKMEKIVEEIKGSVQQQMNVEHAESEIRIKAVRDEGESQGRVEGLMQGREEGIEQGRKEGYERGYNEGRSEGQEAGFTQGKREGHSDSCKSLEDMKTSCDLLLGEKHAIENKYTETLAALVEKHQAEKVNLMKEITNLEAQSINMQSDLQAIEFQVGAVHQELQSAKETFSQEVIITETTGSEDDADLSEDPEDLKEQIKQLSYQLKSTLTVQLDLENLKKDYEALLLDKCELEKTVRDLTSNIPDEDNTKSRSQSAKIKDLNEEKQKMYALLNQTSDQLVKVSTSMALAQSKFVRELESMKQKAKSMVEVESYTKLQIKLVEDQRLVITLQDTLREREAMVDKVMKETEFKIWQTVQIKVKDIQNKLDSTQEELTKYKEKYRKLCAQSGQRNLKLKDLYVENSDLMKTLADSEEQRTHSEQRCRKLNGKCETYRKIIDKIILSNRNKYSYPSPSSENS